MTFFDDTYNKLLNSYSLNDFYHGDDVSFTLPFDDRFEKIFPFDFKKIDQLFNLNWLLSIFDENIDIYKEKHIKIEKKKSTLVFSFGNKIVFSINPDSDLDSTSVFFFDKVFNYDEDFNDIYENVYCHFLDKLKMYVSTDMSFSKFLNIYNSQNKDLLEEKNGVKIYSRNCFKNIISSNEEFRKNALFQGNPLTIVKFKATPLNIRKNLSLFFSNERLNDLCQIISYIQFFNNILDQSFKFKDINLYLTLHSGNRFINESNHYNITISSCNADFFLDNLRIEVSTNSISLSKDGINHVNICLAKDVEDIRQKIISEIENIFLLKLSINREYINFKQLEVLNMYNF